MSASATPASPSACSITGVTSSRWRLDATSGTTPPKRACSSSCEATTLERMSPSALTTAAAVSSQEVSIPRIAISLREIASWCYFSTLSRQYGLSGPRTLGRVQVIADTQERRSGLPAQLRELGVHVEEATSRRRL